jgi:hypothetical protein
MAPRTKQRKPTVRFVRVPTGSLLKLEIDDGKRRFDGAFVKLTPRLRRSERASFDAAAAVKSILDRGAVAAVAVPVTIPDSGAIPEAKADRAQHTDPRLAVRTWFYEAGIPESEESLAAIDACLRILDEVGL